MRSVTIKSTKLTEVLAFEPMARGEVQRHRGVSYDGLRTRIRKLRWRREHPSALP